MAEIPVFQDTFEGRTEALNEGGGARIINGFMDQRGHIHKRPAMAEFTLNNALATTMGTEPMFGCYAFSITFDSGDDEPTALVITVYSDDTDIFISTSTIETIFGSVDDPLRIKALQEDSFAKNTYGTLTLDRFDYYPPRFFGGTDQSNDPAVFIYIGYIVYMKPYDTGSSGSWTSPTVINPTEITGETIDATFINKRLVMIHHKDDTVFYSAAGDPTDFTVAGGGGSFQAESQNDALVRVIGKGNDLYLFGQRSIDIYYNTSDATLPFARYDGAELSIGLTYGTTLVEVDSVFYFISTNGDFVSMKDRQVTVLSNPVADIMNDALAQVYQFQLTASGSEVGDLTRSNVRCMHVKADGNFIVVSFLKIPPYKWERDGGAATEPVGVPGLSLVYHIELNRWYFWTEAAVAGGVDPAAMPMWGTAYDTVTSKTLAIDFDRNKIYGFNFTLRKETGVIRATYSGNKETLVITSGNLDLESHNRKTPKRLTGRMKGAVAPEIRFREGPNTKTWDTPADYVARTPAINTDTGTLFNLHRMGQYRVRQYQIVHSDNSEFSIGDVTEDVELNDS